MTAEQIQAAIAAAMVAHDADGMTIKEIRDALGYKRSEAGARATRQKVEKLIEDGLMVHAGHRATFRIDGVPTRSPVYRLVAS